ncbi:hypothetical protein FQA39_LY15922 [Lamprigera yunnana]|nr:hypothetical protein FQA39_LY15922 [Lamprigera yunnana]
MNRKLPADLKIRAIEKSNEVPSRIKEDVEKIRQWLSKQQHLKVQIDDDRIVAFLRGCKYSLQKVKEKIDFYFTIRTLVPEFFHSRDPLAPEIQAIINAGCYLPLPKPDSKHGARIILANSSGFNPDTMSFINLCVVFYMIMDILLKEDDYATINGLILWKEAKNNSAKYAVQAHPTIFKNFLECTEKAYPLRVKGLYVTNCPVYLEFLCTIVKSFVKNKIAQRMFVFSDIKDLYGELPQSLLPKEYGGENGSVETIKMEWKKKLESYRDWFLENGYYKSDESLRCGERRTTNNVFGVEGSFRKMDID